MGVRKGLSRYQSNVSVYLCVIEGVCKCVCVWEREGVCETQPQKQNDIREISMDEWRKKGSCYLSLFSIIFAQNLTSKTNFSPSIVNGKNTSYITEKNVLVVEYSFEIWSSIYKTSY